MLMQNAAFGLRSRPFDSSTMFHYVGAFGFARVASSLVSGRVAWVLMLPGVSYTGVGTERCMFAVHCRDVSTKIL